tara:strand:+ start:513 stop:746 length:234 start_codon:yes stop_codon:yes gene_type:complete
MEGQSSMFTKFSGIEIFIEVGRASCRYLIPSFLVHNSGLEINWLYTVITLSRVRKAINNGENSGHDEFGESVNHNRQ